MTGRKGPSEGRTDILIQLLDYTVQTFFPQVIIIWVIVYHFIFLNFKVVKCISQVFEDQIPRYKFFLCLHVGQDD